MAWKGTKASGGSSHQTTAAYLFPDFILSGASSERIPTGEVHAVESRSTVAAGPSSWHVQTRDSDSIRHVIDSPIHEHHKDSIYSTRSTGMSFAGEGEVRARESCVGTIPRQLSPRFTGLQTPSGLDVGAETAQPGEERVGATSAPLGRSSFSTQ